MSFASPSISKGDLLPELLRSREHWVCGGVGRKIRSILISEKSSHSRKREERRD